MQPNNITESAHVCNKQGPVCYERRSLRFDLTKWGGQPLPVGAKGVFPVLLRWVGCPSCSQWVRSRSSQRCAIQLRYAPPNMWEQMLQIMLPFFLLFPPPPVCFCFLSRVKSKCLFFGWAYVVTGWSLHDARVPNGTAMCPRENKFITGWWWSVAEILQDWGKIRRRKCRITVAYRWQSSPSPLAYGDPTEVFIIANNKRLVYHNDSIQTKAHTRLVW